MSVQAIIDALKRLYQRLRALVRRSADDVDKHDMNIW
jgi:hypothetical protein